MLEVVKRVDLKCSHHTRKVIMGWDGGVNQPYGGKHFTANTCVKASYCPLKLSSVTCQLCLKKAEARERNSGATAGIAPTWSFVPLGRSLARQAQPRTTRGFSPR